MADKNEKVSYEFTGNSEGLVKAAKAGQEALKQYEHTITNVNKTTQKFTDAEIQRMKQRQASSHPTKIDWQIEAAERKQHEFSKNLEESIKQRIKLTKELEEEQKKLAEIQRKMDAEANAAYAEWEKEHPTPPIPNAIDDAIRQHEAGRKSAFESAGWLTDFFGKRDTLFGGLFAKFDAMKEQFGSRTAGMFGAASGKAVEFGSKMSAVAGKASKVVTVLKMLTNAVKTAASAFVDFGKKNIKFVLTPLKLMGDILGKVKHAISPKALGGNFKQLLGIGAGLGFGKALGVMAKNASDMAESINLINVAMSDNLDVGRKFISTMSETHALDATKLMDTTGTFYEMAAAIEMPSEAATKMATDLTRLSVDVASLFNKNIDSVADNLTSGLRGMSRAVVKYGMDIRKSTLESYAKSIGVTEKYSNMSEANREILRYLVMMRQARDAHSDFARTIEQPANQLKIFKEQITSLSRELGRFLIQVLDPILPVLNGIAMALRLITQFVADLLGVWNGITSIDKGSTDAFDKLESGISGVGSSADKAKKKVKALLLPFDELNIIAKQAETSSGGVGGLGEYADVDPTLLKALEELDVKLDSIKMKAFKVRDKLLEFLGFEYVFDPNNALGAKLEMIPGGFAERIANAVKKERFDVVGYAIADQLNLVMDKLPEKLSWEKLGPKIKKKISDFFDALNAFIHQFHWDSLGATFGEALRTAINTIDYLALEFDWYGFGHAVAESLNSFIQHSDLSVVGKTLGDWLNGIALFASRWAKDFDWHAFGETLAKTVNEFFRTWDMSKLTETASNIILGLIDLMRTFIQETDWYSIGVEIADALKAIPWGEILKGLAGVVTDAFKAKLKVKLVALGELFHPDKFLGSDEQWEAKFSRGAESHRTSGRGGRGSVSKNTIKVGSATGNGFQDPFGSFHMATGGVVTGPTHALIGEGRYNEAVIPLGNSPQMKDMINSIVTAINSSRGNVAQDERPIVVKVMLDGREITTSQNNANRRLGRTMQLV